MNIHPSQKKKKKKKEGLHAAASNCRHTVNHSMPPDKLAPQLLPSRVLSKPKLLDRLVVMAPECFACPEGDRLRWTDRLDIICLGRCSCTNQVSSVSLSVLCHQRMNISPVTQKKKKKKKKNNSSILTLQSFGI